MIVLPHISSDVNIIIIDHKAYNMKMSNDNKLWIICQLIQC